MTATTRNRFRLIKSYIAILDFATINYHACLQVAWHCITLNSTHDSNIYLEDPCHLEPQSFKCYQNACSYGEFAIISFQPKTIDLC